MYIDCVLQFYEEILMYCELAGICREEIKLAGKFRREKTINKRWLIAFAGCQNDFQVQWQNKERQNKTYSLLDQHHLGTGSEPNRSGITCMSIHTY